MRELIEKTKSCGLEWEHNGGSQFSSENTPDLSTTWNFILTKTQIGNVTDTYTLDVKKNTVSYVSIESGPLPKSGRNSVVQELYEIVELIVLELDSKLKETVNFVQNLTDCSD